MAGAAVAITLNGLVPYLADTIGKWQPEVYEKEWQYREALQAYLKARLPKTLIESEYRDLGTTADLCVFWDGLLGTCKVYIEIKRNLKSKTEYNRLVGQIEDLQPNKNRVLVVLCGEENSPTLIQKLRKKYAGPCRDFGDSVVLDLILPTMAIVLVTPVSSEGNG